MTASGDQTRSFDMNAATQPPIKSSENKFFKNIFSFRKQTGNNTTPNINESQSDNEKIAMKDIRSHCNSEIIPKTEFEKFTPTNQLKRCMSETNLTTVPHRNGSAVFIIPMPNECEKSAASILSMDSCLRGDMTNSSFTLTAEGLSLDSGVYDYIDSSTPPYNLNDKKESFESKEETTFSLAFQVFVPFIIAGIGTCGAGLVLDLLQHWYVFREVSELFIVVPALLGLKGNLEMTLASRLSTQANIGNLNTVKDALTMGWGNMALKLAQATVMGFIATAFAVVMDTINAGSFDYQHALLIGCSSISTAAITTIGLGTITTTVVFLSHRCKINPDNIATPVAASLGDITTLGILALIARELYLTPDNIVIPATVMGILIFLVPVWIYFAKKNIYTRQLILTGWLPVIAAVAITSAGGYILEIAVKNYEGMAVFQPVINGVGGNLVAVQASRIATYFHQRSKLGTMPSSSSKLCISPCTAFFGKHDHSRTAKILMLMVIPGHLIFSYSIHLIKRGQTSLTPVFLPIYLVATLLQVAILLYIAHIMIHVMWRWKIDPDNSAIPLLTALGDLLGTGLLATAFYFYTQIDNDAVVLTTLSPTDIPMNITASDIF
ncbi:solute carrier family 41 member 1-like [Centruroides sculpturatus]|uniref:solute carrier family 41 member 1-like n=1 Tax=Centruroides sculpturatus TaxID=218467 RepID=UPI000C6CB6B8|nr:solute carrier family 41 member 1-like [Centruroides sculpturatus]